MRALVLIIALTFLAGCVGGGYSGPSRGLAGDLELNLRGGKLKGVHTTAQEGESPMGYRRGEDGSIEEMYATFEGPNGIGTGMAAHWLARSVYLEKLALVCAIVPEAPICGETQE